MNSIRSKILAFGGAASVAIVLASSASALALSSAAGSSDNGANAATAVSSADLTRLKTRGDAEITRRLTALNKLATVINSAVNLSASNKTSLSNQVSGETSDLTSLKTQLDGETTLAVAQADAQSIITGYRVYALIVPKVYLLKSADTELANNTKLSTLAGKLQDRLNTAKGQGKDVSSLQTKLDDMNAQTASAKGTAEAVETKVLPLLPTDYDSDHSVLEGQKAQLQTAHNQNIVAYSDAKTIVAGLKSLQ